MKKVIFVIFVLIILLCGCEKQDFSIICEPEYPADSKENFSYRISNNSDEGIEVTLAVGISQYKNGEWVQLPFSKEFNEVHYNASMWSEYLSPYSQRLQEFRMCLGDMVDAELTPGKYRLEKKIAFNWYYAEFELR
jgi:hypothetical protein